MQKWKQDYLSNTFRKKTINEDGITLVELLAALSLLSIVILLAGSVHMFGQRQFKSQTESANQANDISYALTEMSSDVRKFSRTDLSIGLDREVLGNDNLTGNEIHLGDGDNKIKYFVDENKLKRNGVVISDSIDSLQAKKEGTYGLNITLTSNSDHSHPKVYQTIVTFRGVDNK